ncbi:MAG: ATP-dependent DNA helicase RecG [Alphaproteobacteria bacterium]|nr:ATP-dependent DNA helicase RecG [Alphaproteobacteria bacterium]MDA8004189.1 ATP-dependent DNA helicase RecG [Alphaproteobacteria bacterium]MDA8005681.1 ATP-dependent DNA helicase RecG [Alphaproteobacteria bacterium]MDA8013074.1 ATP-dependent DNA helicase RecG [Alphaproteobacteria bacterium]
MNDHPILKPLENLRGIGPQRAQLLASLVGGNRCIDLCFLLPNGFIDRSYSAPLATAELDRIGTFIIEVSRVTMLRRPLAIIHCHDDHGTPLQIIYFRGTRSWIQQRYRAGERLAVSGKLQRQRQTLSMIHPDRIEPAAAVAALQGHEAVYPLTRGLSQLQVQNAVRAALALLPDTPEWLDKRGEYPSWKESLLYLHTPPKGEEQTSLQPTCPARQRLALDELFAHQLALAIARRRRSNQGRINAARDSKLLKQARDALPFQLTKAQERALAEITGDLASRARMARLLQGDVGSGKTIVALLAALAVVDAGKQVALMAPTEVLARQHHERLSPMLQRLSVDHELVLGGERAAERGHLRQRLASGVSKVAIGTHALLSDGLDFADLGLAVIDEQHRFGVKQRATLAAKGKQTDILVMSATPIPRTLLMTEFGDLSVSQIDELPPGRKPVQTVATPNSETDNLLSRLGQRMDEGRGVFWVCPRLEESDDEVAAARERAAMLEERFPGRTGLIYGPMKPVEKQSAISNFASGARPLLVATTVVEVGVDVPSAEIMVVEHAERFGLAQLHQLRGRVGRADEPGYCVLLYAPPLSVMASERLRTLRAERDGFVIAERDLELRGAGDLIGTRQSGLPDYRFVGDDHYLFVSEARRLSKQVLGKDQKIPANRLEALRLLLRIFQHDRALQHIKAG